MKMSHNMAATFRPPGLVVDVVDGVCGQLAWDLQAVDVRDLLLYEKREERTQETTHTHFPPPSDSRSMCTGRQTHRLKSVKYQRLDIPFTFSLPSILPLTQMLVLSLSGLSSSPPVGGVSPSIVPPDTHTLPGTAGVASLSFVCRNERVIDWKSSSHSFLRIERRIT